MRASKISWLPLDTLYQPHGPEFLARRLNEDTFILSTQGDVRLVDREQLTLFLEMFMGISGTTP